MNIIIERFNKIKLNISKIDNANSLKIIAISKTFSLKHIMPLIELGHNHFGENKVQEADVKWNQIKKEKNNCHQSFKKELRTLHPFNLHY